MNLTKNLTKCMHEILSKSCHDFMKGRVGASIKVGVINFVKIVNGEKGQGC